ncbi:MAG: DUF1801 domain-containing protein [Pseudomonadota bacterium]
MAEPKTRPIDEDFDTWLATVEPRRQGETVTLIDLFSNSTGFKPHLWSGNMIGFGRYHYTYASGRSGTWFATGFAPRKAKLSIYIMPGYADFEPILGRLGKHKIGKSCLYVNKLPDIDLGVLSELIQAGLDDLGKRWPVKPE